MKFIENAKAGPRGECTVKTTGSCPGAGCALHGVCAHEAAILEAAATPRKSAGSGRPVTCLSASS